MVQASLPSKEFVPTHRVSTRRKLTFASVDDLYRDIEELVIADREGRLTTLGNWTAGQIFAHVAAWATYPFEGFPVKPAPWFVRPFLRWSLRRYLRNGMPAGVYIPRVPGGTVGQERVPTETGAAQLRAAMQRLLSNEPAPFPSPAFGTLSRDDLIRLNLRHAELHLSFLVARANTT